MTQYVVEHVDLDIAHSLRLMQEKIRDLSKSADPLFRGAAYYGLLELIYDENRLLHHPPHVLVGEASSSGFVKGSSARFQSSQLMSDLVERTGIVKSLRRFGMRLLRRFIRYIAD